MKIWLGWKIEIASVLLVAAGSFAMGDAPVWRQVVFGLCVAVACSLQCCGDSFATSTPRQEEQQ